MDCISVSNVSHGNWCQLMYIGEVGKAGYWIRSTMLCSLTPAPYLLILKRKLQKRNKRRHILLPDVCFASMVCKFVKNGYCFFLSSVNSLIFVVRACILRRFAANFWFNNASCCLASSSFCRSVGLFPRCACFYRALLASSRRCNCTSTWTKATSSPLFKCLNDINFLLKVGCHLLCT